MKRYFRDDSGATAVEYGIIVAAIAVAISTAIFLFGSGTADNLGFISGLISSSG